MTASDPILTSARAVLRTCRDDMRSSIDGLPPEALNWRPIESDTNSIAVMAHHALMSTRAWLCVTVKEPVPERDRPAEFEVSYPDADSLLAFVDDMVERCLALIDRSRVVDWGSLRRAWDPSADREFFAAWTLLHALEHLREHVGQISLTRQLWEQATPQ